MSDHDAKHELTSTLHLGDRRVVTASIPHGLSQLLDSLDPEDRAIVEAVQESKERKAMVVIHRGPNKGSRFLISDEAITIGRSKESFIFLDDVTVSRKHGTITRDDAGSFLYNDEGSLNGTYINGELASHQRLSSGDEIQIGKYHFIFISSKTITGEK